MTQYEYKVVKIESRRGFDSTKLEKILNAAGAKGWQVVGLGETPNNTFSTPKREVVLMRPVEPTSEENKIKKKTL